MAMGLRGGSIGSPVITSFEKAYVFFISICIINYQILAFAIRALEF
jgi:hypothetical protein